MGRLFHATSACEPPKKLFETVILAGGRFLFENTVFWRKYIKYGSEVFFSCHLSWSGVNTNQALRTSQCLLLAIQLVGYPNWFFF